MLRLCVLLAVLHLWLLGWCRAWWLMLLRCRMLLKRCAAALCLVQSKLLPLQLGGVYTMLFMLHYLCSTAAAGALPLMQARQLLLWLLRFAWQELIEPVACMCYACVCMCFAGVMGQGAVSVASPACCSVLWWLLWLVFVAPGVLPAVAGSANGLLQLFRQQQRRPPAAPSTC